jgi:hypothetical protein
VPEKLVHVKVEKSRKVRWVGHSERMGERKLYAGFWWEILRERGYFEDSDVDGNLILRWIFSKWDEGRGLD